MKYKCQARRYKAKMKIMLDQIREMRMSGLVRLRAAGVVWISEEGTAAWAEKTM